MSSARPSAAARAIHWMTWPRNLEWAPPEILLEYTIKKISHTCGSHQQIQRSLKGKAIKQISSSSPTPIAPSSMALSNSILSFSSSSSVALRRSRVLDSIDSGFVAHSFHFDSSLTSAPTRCEFPEYGFRIASSTRKNLLYASINASNAASSTPLKSDQDDNYVPLPMVLIDQDSDSDATIVQLSFGDRLGALIDTMKALKELGLDVAKGTVSTEGSVKQTKFFITCLDTGRKVEDPDMLERIRLTIINNLLKYHPESSAQLAMGEAFGIKAPEKKLDVDVATHVHVKEDGPKKSLLYVETADRPGLLVEIIKIIADINIDVESAEIETEGLVAKDKFHVSYRGQALNRSLSEVLVNCLRYYLKRPETDIGSY